MKISHSMFLLFGMLSITLLYQFSQFSILTTASHPFPSGQKILVVAIHYSNNKNIIDTQHLSLKATSFNSTFKLITHSHLSLAISMIMIAFTSYAGLGCSC